MSGETHAAGGRAGSRPQASLATVLKEWGRIGCIGFGGPPAHIALLRKLCVEDRKWLDAQEIRARPCRLQPKRSRTASAACHRWS
jgi:chromate transporter